MRIVEGSKSVTYRKLMKYTCSNPHCKHGSQVEAHHIVPKSKGGRDRYANLITLCRKCHRQSGNHSGFETRKTMLLTWKFYMESKILGITSDCEDRDFLRLIRIEGLREAISAELDETV